MLRRRLLLAGCLLLAASPAGAQKRAPAQPPAAAPPVVWTAADAAKFEAIRKGFPEYAALDDREFSRELLLRVRRVWLADKAQQDNFYRTFVSRLPGYDIYSWKGLHDELVRLLLTAFAHFSSRQ